MNIDFLALGALGVTVLFIGALVFLSKRNVDFGVRTIIAMVIGLIMGIIFKGHTTYIKPIGSIYVNTISAFVVPLIFFSVLSSVSGLESLKRLKTIGVKYNDPMV